MTFVLAGIGVTICAILRKYIDNLSIKQCSLMSFIIKSNRYSFLKWLINDFELNITKVNEFW